MKNRGSFIIAYICLLSLLCLGAGLVITAPREERISQTENRMLQGFPRPEAESLVSGDFMEQFESWLSDGFPGREDAVALSERVMGLFGDRETDIRQELAAESAGEAEPEIAEVSGGPAAGASEPGEPSLPETAAAPAAETEHAAAPGQDAAIWMVAADGSIQIEEEYPAENLANIARVLEEFRECLPADGRILFVNTPVSMQGNRITDSGEYVDWGCSVDEAMNPLLSESITVFDPMDTLRPWLGKENLFSSYDFHWHIEAAYRMAQAMVAETGYPVISFWEFPYKLQYEFYEAPYTPEQLQGMTLERENRLIPQKTSPLESYIVKRMDQLSRSVYMEDDKFGGYGIYLGGRRPPFRMFRTGYHTGRNALVIGDSFYHAFLPYLTPYYDTVLSTDPRRGVYNPQQVGGSLRQYIEKYDVSDIYFVMCNYDSLNSKIFQVDLEKHLNTDWGAYSAWK